MMPRSHLFVFAVFLVMPSASSRAVDLRSPPAARVAVAEQAPVVDGRLDDACWSRGPQIAEFRLSSTLEPAREQTRVYIAYDQEALYVGFRCLEPEMDKLKVTEREFIWRDDSVEVILDPDRDRRGYVQFFINASGVSTQLRNGRPSELLPKEWDARWTGATAQGEAEWTAEIAIPWKSLEMKPRAGTAIAANFARSEKGLPEASAWSADPGGWGRPEKFGDLLMGEASGSLSAEVAIRERESGDLRADVVFTNNSRSPVSFRPKLLVVAGAVRRELTGRALRIEGGEATRQSFALGRGTPDSHLDLQVLTSRSPQFVRSYRLTVPASTPEPVGARLATPGWGNVWEASATFKVMPDSRVPATTRRKVDVYAAKGEYEPFQIVLNPKRGLKGLKVSVSQLAGDDDLPADAVTVRHAERVRVTEVSSPDSMPGKYPDPLVPFTNLDLPAGESSILWFTVRVPYGASPGDYSGSIRLEANGEEPLVIPLSLHVWDFALPKISALRTAYGSNVDVLSRWHGLSDDKDRRDLAVRINQNFIEHRVAPFRPMNLWGLRIHSENGKVVADFSEWDRGAELFLPHMNSFNLPESWMARFEDWEPGTPEYRDRKRQFLRLMADHLKEKGWFEKGYNYVYDEPDPPFYPRVAEEAALWHSADAGYQNLLTEQPEEGLIGDIDIWVPVLDMYRKEQCEERQKAGEDIWWYVCTGPKHPYPNNFIDYPAIDHRILHWMNFKYNVTGVLYWHTMYWRDNPWTTPMSYNDDGSRGFGNGDGNLLYPAVKEKSPTPVHQGPLDSIRWEMIREGIEDYDYLHMLRSAVASAEKAGANASSLRRARTALSQVDRLVRALDDYETDPRELYRARRMIGDALEQLKDYTVE